MMGILTTKCDDAFAVVLSTTNRFNMSIFTKNLEPLLGATDLPGSVVISSQVLQRDILLINHEGNVVVDSHWFHFADFFSAEILAHDNLDQF